jgi:hypothetical protein
LELLDFFAEGRRRFDLPFQLVELGLRETGLIEGRADFRDRHGSLYDVEKLVDLALDPDGGSRLDRPLSRNLRGRREAHTEADDQEKKRNSFHEKTFSACQFMKDY